MNLDMNARPRSRSGRVLVLLRGALGDVLMTLPFLAALPGHFGAEGLTLAGNPTVLNLLANQPFVRGIRNHDSAEWAGLYVTPPEVEPRFRGFLAGHSAAVVLSRTVPDPVADNLEAMDFGPVLTGPMRPPENRPIHLVDQIFRKTGVRPLKAPPLLSPSFEGLEEAGKLLRSRGVDPGSFLVLHPGSGGAHKNWPLPHWRSLARCIQKQLGLGVVWVAGPAEESCWTRLEEMAREEGHALAVGRPLAEVAGLISLSAGHVGHDSGITHLAAELGVPTLALFGPTDPAHWAPRGPKVRILAPPQGKKGDWSWLDKERILSVLAERT